MRTCQDCFKRHCHAQAIHGLPCDCACHSWTRKSKVIKEPRLPSDKHYQAWALLTQTPTLSNQELSDLMGLSGDQHAYWYKQELQKLGVIQIMDNQQRATRILIPFAFQGKKEA